MSGLAFFDTNILVYADDAARPEKQARAIALFAEHLRRGTAVVSLQVLQEYFAAATRKLGLAAEIAQRKVEILARARVVQFDATDIIAAIELHRLKQLSFWDALIVHAARCAGAAVLYTEDLHTGGVAGGVRVVNPFAKGSLLE
ncbi:MAG: twitching motility protein PilT [Terriglobia bacterium]|nr:MAG: twitching motility protein PilT [Terriglobia bacterium]